MHIGKSQKYKLLTDTAKEDFNINKWYELNSQLVLKFERVSTSLGLRCNFFVPFFENSHSDKSLPAGRQGILLQHVAQILPNYRANLVIR